MAAPSGRWRRMQELFDAARALPPQGRSAFLADACGRDAVLRAEVEAMLAADQPEYALAIERMVAERAVNASGPDPLIGMRLGPWRVASVAGRGGMGTVYVADRADGQYEQRVALKVVSGSVPGEPGALRLQAERHILARLSHPNIARLLDAGFTPEGSPYIVMEYVDGLPLTDYCEAQGLKLDERLRLFRIVCDAVQHAHQALVVHRDLKPTNVFVSTRGEVKLLDFGIAKLLDPDSTLRDGTLRAHRALTPAYAAPEQLKGGPVTTATDVYALGIVLFELVAGKRPPQSENVRRGSDRKSRKRTRLPGDLDQVAQKALRPEPHRRYASAGQFGEDIGRFLARRPVVARPDTLMYRARRFVGRNRVACAVAALIVAVVAAFTTLSIRQARRVVVERDRARLEQAKSEQVIRLLVDLFQSANPEIVPGGDRLSIGEFLTRAESRSLRELESQPELSATLRHVLGLVHFARSDGSKARRLLEAAFNERRRLSGSDAPETLKAQVDFGDLLVWQGERERARSVLNDALERIRRTAGENDLLAARTYNRLAGLLPTLKESQHYLERSVEIARQRLPPNDPSRISYVSSLAVLHGRSRPDEARKLFSEALRSAETVNNGKTTLLIRILNDSATFDVAVGDFEIAEKKHRRALALGTELFGAESFSVANSLNNLAVALANQGRAREAADALEQSYETHMAVFGDTHWRTINTMRNVGVARLLNGDAAGCEAWMRRAVDTSTAQGGADGTGRGLSFMRAQLARCLLPQNREDEAFELLQAAVADLETRENEPRNLATSRLWLARLLLDMGNVDEAETHVLAAVGHFRTLPERHPSRAEAECDLAQVHAARGNDEEALALAESCVPLLSGAGQMDPERKQDAHRLLERLRARQ
jgi:tetratricopeptide (TPR) repeat protein